jgi:hypothetical protein
MQHIPRRELLRLAASALAAVALPRISFAEPPPGERYITNFYQFNADAIRRLSQPGALPSGPQYLHLFCKSTAGAKAHPELTRLVQKAGESFKFTWGYDAHKHKGWEHASEDELKRWAIEFREAAFTSGAPPDYFAFNEMPPDGHLDPEVRGNVTRLVRNLHDAGGGPKWRGMFYFVEPNAYPNRWQGDSTELWETLDATCDLVVAEHYHTNDWIFARTLDQFRDHLFQFPRWLRDSGQASRVNIAQNKFAVLHSSYWGAGYQPWAAMYRDISMLKFPRDPARYKDARITPWQGMIATEHETSDLEKFFQRCIAATRSDELGKSRIAFGPLALTPAMGSAMLPILARVLGKDAERFAKGVA